MLLISVLILCYAVRMDTLLYLTVYARRSLVLGPLFIATFFAFSLVTVLGVKTLIAARRRMPAENKSPTKKRKSYRTVNIDPDEVDRISFGKKP